MGQTVIVYILIALAMAGACRYGYRKIKALKKGKEASACNTCPLKENCSKKPGKEHLTVNDKRRNAGCNCEL